MRTRILLCHWQGSYWDSLDWATFFRLSYFLKKFCPSFRWREILLKSGFISCFQAGRFVQAHLEQIDWLSQHIPVRTGMGCQRFTTACFKAQIIHAHLNPDKCIAVSFPTLQALESTTRMKMFPMAGMGK